MKKHYVLDVLLFIAAFLCIFTGIILDFRFFSGGRNAKIMLTNWHIYSGYTILAGLVLHLAWHWSWLQGTTRLLIGNKAKSKAAAETGRV
jgi:hypothetical protein